MVLTAEQVLVSSGQLKPKDVLGVVAGTRQSSGSTNLMRLHVVTEQEAEQIAHGKQRVVRREGNRVSSESKDTSSLAKGSKGLKKRK